MKRRMLAVAAALHLAPGIAAGHEVLHEVDRGRAVAVRAWYGDGEPLAYCAYEVFSPADPRIPHQTGRTDRSGWVAFVPDAPGTWRVKVADATGHGLALAVEAGSPLDAGAAAPGSAAWPSVAFVLRPLVGLAVLGAVFAALHLAHRRRRTRP